MRNLSRYIVLRPINGITNTKFWTTNNPSEDMRKLITGQVAYEIIGYADTVTQAQILCYGRSYTSNPSI